MNRINLLFLFGNAPRIRVPRIKNSTCKKNRLIFVLQQLKRNTTSPLSAEYRPELDQSPELSPKDAAYDQSLIGILRWPMEVNSLLCVTVILFMQAINSLEDSELDL